MNRRAVWAVVRRDLTVVLASKAVVLPAVIVPAVLLLGLPALAGLAPQVIDAATAGDLDALLGLLPADRAGALSDDAGLRAAELLVTYLFAPMVLLVPVMFAAVIAADAIAGEKERGTLEGVLLTPLTDRELVTAKLLAAWLPAAVLGVTGAVAYAVVANLAVGSQVGRLVLPTPEFAAMALLVGPAFAAAALAAVLLTSVRAKTTQEAFQLGGVVVLPVIGLLVSQAVGALLLSVTLLLVAAVVALALAGGLLAVGVSRMSRTRMGERLG
jgi:ABC-2 type transport system permease protein